MVEGESMIKEPRKRTEKVFEEYNDYQDRGMVKWLTAFSMEELTRSISAGKEEALKDIPILAQMNASEIDEVLTEALQKNRPVSIQLNQKDHLGRQTESIVGYFRGSLLREIKSSLTINGFHWNLFAIYSFYKRKNGSRFTSLQII